MHSGWGVGDVPNLLAERIISAVMFFVLFFTRDQFNTRYFCVKSAFCKKWASGKRLVMDLTQSVAYLAIVLHV